MSHRTDIAHALDDGRKTYWYCDRMSEAEERLASEGLRLDRDAARQQLGHCPIHQALYELLLEVKAITNLFNDLPAGRRVRVETFTMMTISIFSRLIWFSPLQNPCIRDTWTSTALPKTLNSAGLDFSYLVDGVGESMSNLNLAYHAGLTIFMMSLFLQYECRRIMGYDSIFGRLAAVVDRVGDKVDRDLLLWILLVSGVWSRDLQPNDWITVRTKGVIQEVGFSTYDEAREYIKKFPWTKAKHTESCRKFWNFLNCPGLIELNRSREIPGDSGKPR